MKRVVVILVVGLAAATAARAAEGRLTVDCSQTNGMIRPLHGVNLGPLCYRGTVDLSEYHRELAVPYTRVHDVVWVNAPAVDISTIFRDFRDDPSDPSNYDFAATDDYLAAILKVGSRIVYRLGESIEHTPRQYRVHPPSDPDRWAAICLGIIRHYNEGWADGFHHDIRYWEIWNEPEVRPAMWTGTDAQYFHLYETTAKAIKARFPNLKVGGPALGNVGTWEGDEFVPSEFCLDFLRHCRQTDSPLDFFSWHRYTADPALLPRLARGVRSTLDEHGFKTTESHLNEWNYLPGDDWGPLLQSGQGKAREDWFRRMNGPEGAAFAAYALIALQDSPVDVANYYTGEIQGFGLFDFNGLPKKTFYAFKAFRTLLNTPHRIDASLTGSGMEKTVVTAGRNDDPPRAAVLISRFHPTPGSLEIELRRWPWGEACGYQILLVDAEHDLTVFQKGMCRKQQGNFALTLPLSGPAVALVLFQSHP